jgi:hypothetical protein
VRSGYTRARGEADGGPPTEAALTATRTPAALLDRGTRHRAVGTEHAAIAGQRLKPRSAALAIIEELASVGGHRFDGLVLALRTGQDRVKLHFDRLAVRWFRGQSNACGRTGCETTDRGLRRPLT